MWRRDTPGLEQVSRHSTPEEAIAISAVKGRGRDAVSHLHERDGDQHGSGATHVSSVACAIGRCGMALPG